MEDVEEEGDIVCRHVFISPLLTYFLKNPPVCATQNYLNENKVKLKSEIEGSVGFNQVPRASFEMLDYVLVLLC